MGKRLKQQVRGSGTGRYRVPDTITKYRVMLPKTEEKHTGRVVDLIDDPVRTAVIAKIQTDKYTFYVPAAEGLYVGQEIQINGDIPNIGNILPLDRIPDGYYVYMIENKRLDGGKYIRSAGGYGIVLSRDEKGVYVKLPSRKVIVLPKEARAIVGVVSGGGYRDKPLVKAGNAYYRYRKLHRIWPRNRGVKMSPYDHPHGGKQHHEGKATTVSRNAAPGQKVGHLAARSTGRKKAKS
ncbi:MAG: 50S ribosomal protein L2 [Candidatus Micrarchaeota archaeon]|nr:50S ribosomal protein L2 [Candidatus Micrarchaeota archaeon]MCX8154669.1 50S ribosomal protein L2 [Candidatus Micrarchaeota archaeon]